MKVDIYTQSILTIIAGSLLWIAVQQTMGDAIAQNSSSQITPVVITNDLLRVAICNEKLSRCADIATGGKLEVDED